MYDRKSIKEGMAVRSSDGHKLGKVFAIGDSQFQIEKGLFFPKDYLVNYSDIADIQGHDIILRHGKEALRGAEGGYADKGYADRGYAGPVDTTPAAGIGAGVPTTTATGAYDERMRASRHEDLRGSERHDRDIAVPIVEEELDVVKRDRAAGEVKVHKTVETEHKTVEVPLRQEKVTVERTAATGRTPTGDAFREETISVPVHAEEVEVRKRPVVREEVRIHKDRFEQERRVAADVRKEKVDIDSEGEVDDVTKRKGGIGSPDIDDKTRY